jgi:YidC/Oxa1 family membrane protein insertase
MNKQDFSIVAILCALLLGWWLYTSKNKPTLPQPIAPIESVSSTNAVSSLEAKPFVADKEPSKVIEAIDNIQEAILEEKSCVVSNSNVSLTFSSVGASIKNAKLFDYKEENTADSSPVDLSFTNAHALVIGGIPGLGANHNFDFQYDEANSKVTMSKKFGSLAFERTAVLTNDYVVRIEDTFRNISSTVVVIPTNTIRTGQMEMVQTTAMTRGISYLGLDTLNKVGKKDEINYWAKIGIIKKSPLIKQFK